MANELSLYRLLPSTAPSMVPALSSMLLGQVKGALAAPSCKTGYGAGTKGLHIGTELCEKEGALLPPTFVSLRKDLWDDKVVDELLHFLAKNTKADLYDLVDGLRQHGNGALDPFARNLEGALPPRVLKTTTTTPPPPPQTAAVVAPAPSQENSISLLRLLPDRASTCPPLHAGTIQAVKSALKNATSRYGIKNYAAAQLIAIPLALRDPEWPLPAQFVKAQLSDWTDKLLDELLFFLHEHHQVTLYDIVDGLRNEGYGAEDPYARKLEACLPPRTPLDHWETCPLKKKDAILPCGHGVCAHCAQLHIDLKKPACPRCQKSYESFTRMLDD